ncbi:GNAT family N-acetyltransferase [Microbacterium sp. KSW4-4]|uniref:GNAT family N-acetyltransferase n=1 Tax=Microbacterium sp. KSW4-4 TaxID=2851651 RepID=UPI001FFCC973|nr:GNAT family N-acetyltransferase [Microbacterium sp. KSW4-4]MCK2032209.1 N-acetyltransferase [Microbacterium sp. KSW4-4]
MDEYVVMQARKEPSRVACWEEDAGGVTHGTLTMRWVDDGDLYLEHVEVAEAWRGKGVATRLLDMALATYRLYGEKLTVLAHSTTSEMDALLSSARRRHPDFRFIAIGDDDE